MAERWITRRGINGCGSKQMLKSEIKHNLFLIKNFMLENREFLFLLLIYRMVMVINPYQKKKKNSSESCLIASSAASLYFCSVWTVNSNISLLSIYFFKYIFQWSIISLSHLNVIYLFIIYLFFLTTSHFPTLFYSITDYYNS